MSNAGTQGLDALAALCGSASEENAALASAHSLSLPAAAALPPQANLANLPPGAPQPNNLALYAQQQQQQQQQAQALQLQQVQQVLAMRQAAAAAQQQQQQQQQQHQQQQAAAIGLNPQLNPQLMQHAQQLQSMIAQQQQQQAQQQQHQQQAQQQVQQHQQQQVQQQQFGQQQAQQQQLPPVFGQQAQANALAAQIMAAQQQQQRMAPSGMVALPPATLAGLAGGQVQVLPGASALSQLGSPSPALTVMSPALQVTNKVQVSSPSTLAMPPPPTKAVPNLPLSNNPGKSASKTSRRVTRDGPSKSKSRKSAPAPAQPPIEDIILEWEDKKHAKRAANRLSAHLSRKRKKMFIEDLKDENLELRRKELILRSIPDLIVVFDSSGCISFVSHSVVRFMDYTPEELTGTSFWERLTLDSVRLIKSAFMDALAVKRPVDEDSTPLANGESVTVTLVRRDDEGEERPEGLLVSLKGVVHFAGESPECVCSVRPEPAAASGGAGKARAAVAVKDPPSPRSGPLKKRAAHQISDIDSEQS